MRIWVATSAENPDWTSLMFLELTTGMPMFQTAGKTGFTMWILAGSMFINQINYLRAPGYGKRMSDGSGLGTNISNGSTTRGLSNGCTGREVSTIPTDGSCGPRMTSSIMKKTSFVCG